MLEWNFKLLEHQDNLTKKEHRFENDIEQLKIIERLLTHPDTLKILKRLSKFSKSLPAPKHLKQQISLENRRQTEKVAEEKRKIYWDAEKRLMDAEDKASKSGDFLLAESIEDQSWKLSHDFHLKNRSSPTRTLYEVERFGYLAWELYGASFSALYSTQNIKSREGVANKSKEIAKKVSELKHDFSVLWGDETIPFYNFDFDEYEFCEQLDNLTAILENHTTEVYTYHEPNILGKVNEKTAKRTVFIRALSKYWLEEFGGELRRTFAAYASIFLDEDVSPDDIKNALKGYSYKEREIKKKEITADDVLKAYREYLYTKRGYYSTSGIWLKDG